MSPEQERDARIRFYGAQQLAYIEDHGEHCDRCMGAGKYVYPSTSTWRGGIGGCAMTLDVCDACWGSGVEGKPWPSHRTRRVEGP